MSNGESQTQSCILIDGTTSVLAAHSTDGGKTCRQREIRFQKLKVPVMAIIYNTIHWLHKNKSLTSNM